MKSIRVPTGFRCPLCPDHQDDENDFAWSNLLDSPICFACTYELWNCFHRNSAEGVVMPDGKVDPTFKTIQALTGFSFEQAKFEYFKEFLDCLPDKEIHRLKELDPRQMSDEQLQVLNETLDFQFMQIALSREQEGFKSTWSENFAEIINALRKRV